MNRKQKNIILITLLAIIIIAITYLQIKKEQPATITMEGETIKLGLLDSARLKIGGPAPNFQLLDFSDKIVKLSDFRGRPVMVDFWANWCPFCHTEFPFMEEAYVKYKNRGFVILGVHRTETESVESGLELIFEAKSTFPLLQDKTGAVYKTYSEGRSFMPMSFFIDKDGILRAVIIGPKTSQQLEENIKKILP